MKSEPNKTRKHHYVAQCLQREFSFDGGNNIYGFDIRSRNSFALSKPNVFKIEDNLQSKDMFLIDHTEGGKQYNLEDEFCRAENLFGKNMSRLNKIAFEDMERDIPRLRDILKNLAVYSFLDAMRNPLRLPALAQCISSTNQTFQGHLNNVLSESWLTNTPNVHTKLLAVAFERNDYIDVFNALLTKTEAWVSSALFCYTESFLGGSGIALSDYSVLVFNENDGIVNYVISISNDKLLSIRIDTSLVLSIISGNTPNKKRRKYQPDIRVIIDNEKVLTAYNLLAIHCSKDRVFSNLKTIFGVYNYVPPE
ncbi:DUF4238 domain-containing protein [Vibrio owensii]|uniref:DUF4238 domain-containing protein n=1 Tax=Vibrio owensii TaxID=696485 RepID=UPI0040681305